MTVGELIKELQDLPTDMEVQVMTAEGDGPSDIVQLTRGSYDGEELIEVPNGQVGVIVTW